MTKATKAIIGHSLKVNFSEREKERFWKKVSIAGPDECWNWNGAISKCKNGSGYGSLCVLGRQVKAHRVSFAINKGAIPAGMFVCHKCDNRRCVNPAHLFLGTQSDNIRDCSAKGRMITKLTKYDVFSIRHSRENGEKLKVIAARFGVSTTTVSAIVRRRKWKCA